MFTCGPLCQRSRISWSIVQSSGARSTQVVHARAALLRIGAIEAVDRRGIDEAYCWRHRGSLSEVRARRMVLVRGFATACQWRAWKKGRFAMLLESSNGVD